MQDCLGNRMKEQYENRTRYLLPRRTYTIIRLDGKAFHSFTKDMKRPFDSGLMSIMDEVAKALCKEVQGCVLAYVQSDEISLVLTDFENIGTCTWFDGNIQKIASISAAIATREFNRLWISQTLREVIANKQKITDDLHSEFVTDIYALAADCFKLAVFDSRVFSIPDRTEVVNYLIWRQQDATRNSIQMVAQSLYSQKELHGKNCNILQEMIFQKGINWNNYTSREKRGGLIIKNTEAFRRPWTIVECPIFTQSWDFLSRIIPYIGEKE